YLQIGEHTSGSVEHFAKLIAVGTFTQPITFTSKKKAPAAGDWPGIFLADAPGSRLSYVNINFAGGFNGIGSANCKPNLTTDQAGLFIGTGDGSYIPSPSDFDHVNINDSASHGI